jgi:alkylhydroperoxidase family enzyme
MAPYLPPVGKPRSPLLKVVYYVSRRMFGKVATPVAVHSARMPTGFLLFYGKVSRLDRKLKLPASTAVLVREQVASTNMCLFCMDASRYAATRMSADNAARFDALPEYAASPLFSEAERAALDYATELTATKEVAPATFAALRRHYDEREICDIVWLVASEHLYNMTNVGLGIGSDGLCEMKLAKPAKARA